MLTRPIGNLVLSRYEWALQCLQRTPRPSVVFDIGAGNGYMKAPLEARGCSWYGFDIAPTASNIRIWNLIAPCPETVVRPDVVLLLDVVEHLANPGIGLANIREVLSPGGWLVMTMPNPRWSRSRISALLYGDLAAFTQSDLDLNGHVFTPWPHVMNKMLIDAGFKVEEYSTLDGRTEWPGHPISIRYPLRMLSAIASKVIEYSDPSACGFSYGLLARVQVQ